MIRVQIIMVILPSRCVWYQRHAWVTPVQYFNNNNTNILTELDLGQVVTTLRLSYQALRHHRPVIDIIVLIIVTQGS